MIEIKTLSVGYLQTNCYIVTDGKFAVVVDPGGGYEKIKAYLADRGLRCDAVLLTHGHFDHIMALSALKKDGAKVYIHENDEKMLRNEWNLAAEMGLPSLEVVQADVSLCGGEKLVFGEMNFEVIHTPGHTQGGVCYDCNGEYLFSGDTLFAGTYGRTDLYGGSSEALRSSVEKLFAIDGDRTVYPGHYSATTLERERAYNPALREL